MRSAHIEEITSEITPGATHSNVFAQHGIPGLAIGAGCRNPHRNDEYLVIDEMVGAALTLVYLLDATRNSI